MEKSSHNSSSHHRQENVIVISNCCSPNCPGNSGGVRAATAAVASAVFGGGCQHEYDSLCECMDRDDGVCRCGQRERQIKSTTWLRPQNWTHWPIIKRVLIGSAITFVLVWLFVYLVLHFYVQAL